MRMFYGMFIACLESGFCDNIQREQYSSMYLSACVNISIKCMELELNA